MKVSYELTADDLSSFTLFHTSHSPAARRQRAGCLSAGVLSLLLLPGLILLNSEKPFLQTAKDIWPLLVGPFLFLAFVIPYIQWRTRNVSKKLLQEGRNSGFYGPCTLSLEADGIRESKDSGESMRKWSSVEKLIVTTDYLFIYTSGIEAFVVPSRAFPNRDEVVAFQQYIASRSHVEAQVA